MFAIDADCSQLFQGGGQSCGLSMGCHVWPVPSNMMTYHLFLGLSLTNSCDWSALPPIVTYALVHYTSPQGLLVQVFNCPLSAMALQNVAKPYMAGIPLPDIVGGNKEGWYSDLIFAVGTKDGKLQATQQYDQIKRAQSQAGIRKTGVISHLNRHVAAVQARVLYSESIAEVAVAGNWRVDILSGVYAQVGSADSIAHRAGYSSRAAVGNFRQLLTPLDWDETAAIVEALFPGLGAQLQAMQEVAVPPAVLALLHSSS